MLYSSLFPYFEVKFLIEICMTHSFLEFSSFRTLSFPSQFDWGMNERKSCSLMDYVFAILLLLLLYYDSIWLMSVSSSVRPRKKFILFAL